MKGDIMLNQKGFKRIGVGAIAETNPARLKPGPHTDVIGDLRGDDRQVGAAGKCRCHRKFAITGRGKS